MISMNFSSVRNNFKEVCDNIFKNLETVIVTRKNDENIVMMSESEYNNLIENAYIRSSRANYEHLMKSVGQAEKGNLKKVDLFC